MLWNQDKGRPTMAYKCARATKTNVEAQMEKIWMSKAFRPSIDSLTYGISERDKKCIRNLQEEEI